MVRLPDSKTISIPTPHLRYPEECQSGGEHDWAVMPDHPGTALIEQHIGSRCQALLCSKCNHVKWQALKPR